MGLVTGAIGGMLLAGGSTFVGGADLRVTGVTAGAGVTGVACGLGVAAAAFASAVALAIRSAS